MARYYTLEHLPPQKRSQLQQIVRLLRDSTAVEMIILFGSYARGDWVEDPEGGYVSDFDILVVVESATLADDTLWHDLQEQARRLTNDTLVSFIVHDIEEVNDRLAQGSEFFREIKEDGIVLYDSHRHKLADADAILASTQTQPEARERFKWYFREGEEWLRQFENHLGRGYLNRAAFELHQAAEAYYKTVLMVLADSQPKLHDLSALGNLCGNLHSELRDVIPRQTKAEKHRAELLERAYRDARYRMTYTITRSELELLAKSVRLLRERTKSVCHDFIASLDENSASARS